MFETTNQKHSLNGPAVSYVRICEGEEIDDLPVYQCMASIVFPNLISPRNGGPPYKEPPQNSQIDYEIYETKVSGCVYGKVKHLWL
jgi:hypothetical protein